MALYREQTRDASTGEYAATTRFPGDEIEITCADGSTLTGLVWYQGRQLRYATFRELLVSVVNGATLRGDFTIQRTDGAPACGLAVTQIRHLHKVNR